MTVLYRYRFGAVVFDEGKLELVVAGLPVDVQPRPLQVLSLLLARGGEVVTREEFFERVWLDRPTVENVLPNAITKLRNALGEGGTRLIENLPRIGYRFAGRFERTVVGRSFASKLELSAGQAVLSREGFMLDRILGQSHGHEVWLASHRTTGEQRVYKFASSAEHVAGLKREATLGRLLRDELGERADLVRLIDWNFDAAPFYLESAYGGEDLAQWASGGDRLRAATPSERHDLFLQIVDAVAAAHGVAVLHKDLKPGNILVTGVPGAWQARLADFGSGRLLEPERLAQLGITSMGLTMAHGVSSDATRGTLMYLAPELLQDQPATVRSDVYALGVLLYQLTVGELRRPLVPGWERDVADELLREDIAAATDSDPTLRTASAAELAIRLRTLEPRRAERGRLETERAAKAANDEALRRVRMRRPWVVACVGLLCTGLAVSLFLYERMRVAQRALVQEHAASLALNRFLTQDFIAMANPSVTGRHDVTVIEAAGKAAAKIDVVFSTAAPEVRAALHVAMQQTLSGLSDYKGSIGEGVKALDALAQSSLADPRQEAEIRLTQAAQWAQISRFDDAVSELNVVDALLKKTAFERSESGARLWWVRGLVAGGRYRLGEALEDYGKAWALAQQLPGITADLEERIQLSLGDAHKMTGHLETAESVLRELLARQRVRYGMEHVRPCYTSVALASVLGYAHGFDEAITMAKAAANCLSAKLGTANNRTVTAYDILAGLYFQQDRYDDAAEAYAEVVRGYSALLGDRSLSAIMAHQNAATALQYAGHPAQAERELTPVLDTARATFGEEAPVVQSLRYRLADCRLDQRRTEGVAALLAGLSPEVLAKVQIAPDWDGRLAYQHGRLALEQGDRAQALTQLEAAARVIALKNPEGRISDAVVHKLIDRAKAKPVVAAR